MNPSQNNMKEEIITNLDHPEQLERLYRADESGFKNAFNNLFESLQGNPLATFWHARLNYTREVTQGRSYDLVWVIMAALVAGLIAKLPSILSIKEEFFYSRNIGFVIFPVLTSYFAWKNKLSPGKIIVTACGILAGLLFINFLPDVKKSDTLLLSCIHMILWLWAILGFAFVGEEGNNMQKRLGYLKYNGDLVVMTTLIVIAGAILTGVTFGLFSLIGWKIEQFYFEYIIIFALPAAPILGTWLTMSNPQLVGKVSPVIARIFSPLVLVTLVIYLVAIIFSGKDPYNDRDFLMIFNALLIGVMAIIFFSIAEMSKSTKNITELWVLFLLSVVTILVNGIALSAILFRISEWGITPNRAAVLGGNVLILIHLLLVTAQLERVLFGKTEISRVGKAIASYLPIYVLWTIIVTFIFPFIFSFK